MNNNKKKSKNSVITGIVIPDKWDADGKILAVTIHTNDEKIFLVEQSRIGTDLLTLINQEVEVTGKVRERFDGKTSIGVKSYKVMDEQSESNIALA